ncbi:hypothetical protein LOCC1_G001074 [Lachnellula occidentalis]|uniref:Uncharacterized protein n=1 Tax=Lachnellula occidentalis TaxID=215460 RepID=A0A8H8UJB4_9HELO|nr:hypothetical protein LOCC1_G001074 [Lachnellula occidentalis]
MARTKRPAPHESEVGAGKSQLAHITNGLAGLSIVQVDALGPPKLNKKNIAGEFNRYFGDVSKLENWQRFCQDIGLDVEELTTLTKCKNELSGVWINIYDFIDSQREGKIPRRFPTQRQLSVYTRNSKKVYPKKKAKEGGPVRALLAHIF